MFRSVKRMLWDVLRTPMERVQRSRARVVREVYRDDEGVPNFMINPL